MDMVDLHAFIRGFVLMSQLDDSVKFQITHQPENTQVSALFPKITHLSFPKIEWHSSNGEIFHPTFAHHFPSLTHLAHEDDDSQISQDAAYLESVLRDMKCLKALALWKEGEKLAVREDESLPVHDERIVLVTTHWARDWEREARGIGLGIWTLADRILEDRRKDK